MKPISRYWVDNNVVRVKTESYSDKVRVACRSIGGTFIDGCWVLPIERLPDIQEMLGKDFDDLVEAEVCKKDWSGFEQITIGWYVLASRRYCNSAAEIYGKLVAGSIPYKGGSKSSPSVRPSDDAKFHIWVPRDFALARGLPIVTDPKAAKAVEDRKQQNVRCVLDLMKKLGVTLADLTKEEPCLS